MSRADQQVQFVGGQAVPGGGGEQRPGAVQVVQQVGGAQHRPHPFQRIAHLIVVADARTQVFGGDRLARALGQPAEHPFLNLSAARVVVTHAAANVGHNLPALCNAEAQALQPEGHHQGLAQCPLTVLDRLSQQRHHAQVALDSGDGQGFGDRHPGIGDEVADHRGVDARFAQRRQHLIDVGQKQPVGPYHQHALPLERKAVGVEQIGGPVERHHRLAGAGPALHHQHAGQRRADHLVLLALDGRHDVGQLARAAFLQCRHQRAVPLHRAVVQRLGRRAEQFVVHAQQRSTPDGEVAATNQAHRVRSGCSVERFGHRRPPVDHDGVLGSVGHRHASDVKRLGAVGGGVAHRRRLCVGRLVGAAFAVGVDATEQQGGVTQFQLGQPGGHAIPDHVPLVTGLEGAARLVHDGVADTLGGPTGGVQALIGKIDVGLLGRELGIWAHGTGNPPLLIGPNRACGAVLGTGYLTGRAVVPAHAPPPGARLRCPLMGRR